MPSRRTVAILVVGAVVLAGTIGWQFLCAQRESTAYQQLRVMGATGDDWVGWREVFGSNYRPIVQIQLPPTVTLTAALPLLAQLDNLEAFDLTDSSIRDPELIYLQQLDWITSLRLSETGITDAGVPALSQMQNLRFLHIENTSVTDNGFEELRRALPHCRITK